MSRVGQTWMIQVSDRACSELIGLVVEDGDTEVATLLVIHSTGVFEERRVGTLSRDMMTMGWNSWRWERIS